MYLFRGEFGYMLYTGDFRWQAASKRAQIGRTMLLNAIKNETVDILYLDNTYCNPSYSFPSREVAAQQVVDIITSHPEHDIVIGIDTLGKEDLLLYISRVLKMKIWVWPERLQIMHLLGFHDIFTTKTSLTRVRAVPRYSFSIDTLEGLNSMHPTIGIMPSGLPWAAKSVIANKNPFGSSSVCHRKASKGSKVVDICTNPNVKTIEQYHQHIYSVPYSDHSCFSEILDFVKLLRPVHMKGIVSSSCSYVDPIYYLGHLCRENQPSGRLYWKPPASKEGGGTVEGVQTKSTAGISNFAEAKQRRSRRTDILGVRVNRVSVLRRLKRGAKIVENELCGLL
ncbi:hypothetical protein RJ639_002807 [Escallonia herrerae]|uniref:Protein artemis n=1 Tax=Escallonia herrerae TaxID=1293975 RepID=A0AA88W8L8_9ASTE|nr:hypothetical protein RJ639_002807 [Escallonia herrerae]